MNHTESLTYTVTVHEIDFTEIFSGVSSLHWNAATAATYVTHPGFYKPGANRPVKFPLY
jgi:hypothetical protein